MAVNNYLDNSELAERIFLANGQVVNASFIHKFGAVEEMSQNTVGSVWDVDDTLYPWSVFDTPGVLSISTVAAGDNGSVIKVIGLDSNFNAVEEDFTVSSSGSVTGTVSFSRVYRAFVTNNGGTNVQDINVLKAGTIVLRIRAAKGQTLMAIYTVPRGYTGFLMKQTMTCQANADATGEMFIRYPGQPAFRVGHSFEVSGNGGQYMYDFSVPIKIPAMSDIDMRANVRSNNARLSAAFDIVLWKTK